MITGIACGACGQEKGPGLFLAGIVDTLMVIRTCWEADYTCQGPQTTELINNKAD